VTGVQALEVPGLQAERHLVFVRKLQSEIYGTSMAKIFCVANQKGGVGKTTTTVNLAAGLAKLEQRVLLVDLDPQGNATMGAGINKAKLTASVYEVLLGMSDVATARQRSESGKFDVLPANRELAGAEVEMVELDNRDKRLRDALSAVADEYDFILIGALRHCLC
jgi:chromosome partitioning protein